MPRASRELVLELSQTLGTSSLLVPSFTAMMTKFY